MIHLQNIQKSFNGQKALDNLSLEIQAGEIYGLLGANGAGKSTTLNLLLGFLTPDSGTISMGKNSKTDVGYIPENVNLYPYLSGIENLDYFCKLAGLKYKENELSDFLTECGLAKKLITSGQKPIQKECGKR